MKRPLHNDPTVPAYLPPWPTQWPDTEQQARRMVRDMQPHPTARRTGYVIAVVAGAVAAVGTLIAFPLVIAVPGIVAAAAAVVGIREKTRRRHARAIRRAQKHQG